MTLLDFSHALESEKAGRQFERDLAKRVGFRVIALRDGYGLSNPPGMWPTARLIHPTEDRAWADVPQYLKDAPALRMLCQHLGLYPRFIVAYQGEVIVEIQGKRARAGSFTETVLSLLCAILNAEQIEGE